MEKQIEFLRACYNAGVNETDLGFMLKSLFRNEARGNDEKKFFAEIEEFANTNFYSKCRTVKEKLEIFKSNHEKV